MAKPSKQSQQPAPEPVVESAPVATVVVEPKAPVERRGKSTVEHPVAATWAFCMNELARAHKAGQPVPSRKALVNGAHAMGIAWYTARTQVGEFLKASKGGTQVPARLPKGLVIR